MINFKHAKAEATYEIVKDIPLDRLEAICNAERDGRLVVLDYSLGDSLFHRFSEITEGRIKRIQINSKGMFLVDRFGAWHISEIGKTVFRTREAALKGESHENKA